MSSHDDRFVSPNSLHDPNPCDFHSSEGWVLVEAVIAIFTGLVTILLVLVRHPFKTMYALIFIAIVGTILGWWAV